MKRRYLVPTLAVLYYVVMTIAVTYPGYVPANRITPFVFGMPFSLFWQVLWICGAILVLSGVFFWEERQKRGPLGDDEAGQPSTDEAAR